MTTATTPAALLAEAAQLRHDACVLRDELTRPGARLSEERRAEITAQIVKLQHEARRCVEAARSQEER